MNTPARDDNFLLLAIDQACYSAVRLADSVFLPKQGVTVKLRWPNLLFSTKWSLIVHNVDGDLMEIIEHSQLAVLRKHAIESYPELAELWYVPYDDSIVEVPE